MNKGKVYIIGVGPGDYKLITLKAVECIAESDVIVYDRLINSKVLSYARSDAELIYVGKTPGFHAVPQKRINEILVKKAAEGKLISRVKGGDPFVFGRGGEEGEYLRENGVEFEVVPGVTSAVAVPAYAGIPVTHRDYCSSLHIITGHKCRKVRNGSIDYEVISKLEGTLIFLMGVKQLPQICQSLVKAGKRKSTPVAVIEKGTTYEQKVITGTLEDICEKVRELGILPPAVTVVGDIVNLQKKLDWKSEKVLSGKRIAITRARKQAAKLVKKIEELGGEVVEIPTIKIVKPDSFEFFDKILGAIKRFNWIVFTSVNGVNAFLNRMRDKSIDIRELSGIKLSSIGKATTEELKNHGLNVEYMPEKYTTKHLLQGLLKLIRPGEKVLLARADIANKELIKGLQKNGIRCTNLVVYKTEKSDISRSEILKVLEDKTDFITFTSSSTVNNFVSIIGQENIKKVSKSKVVCIGPVTAKAANDLGITVKAVADVHTLDGVMQKLTEVL